MLDTRPMAKKATTDGTTQKAIWRSPLRSRSRNLAAISSSVPSALDISGSSDADTAIPNSPNGSRNFHMDRDR